MDGLDARVEIWPTNQPRDTSSAANYTQSSFLTDVRRNTKVTEHKLNIILGALKNGKGEGDGGEKTVLKGMIIAMTFYLMAH